ncbi:MAG: GGDEF domain-containing protein [Spirochaetaceae bacterium]|nr:MAG: GGDEF domain-containing protein [Spirochaetaceae bacterium]
MSRVDELEKENFDLRQLLEIGKSLNSTLEYNRLIDSILHTCLAQMRVLQAGVFVRREADHTELVLNRDYIGFELDHSIPYTIPPNHPLRQQLIDMSDCYTLQELNAALPADSPDCGLSHMPYELVVPLIARSDLQGIIVLGRRIDDSEFTADERRYALDIGGLAAIAVYNAYLFDRATIDSLTRLKQRHVLEERMMHLFKRHGDPEQEATERSEIESLSFLMLDVDYFKPVNDTYGHKFGDEVLRRLAEIVVQHTRPVDIAARYGGEEFVVMLPNLDAQGGAEVAERIRLAVEDFRFCHGDKELKITVSIGVAEYTPALDQLPGDLMARADEAMYEAKSSGRNRVIVARDNRQPA